MRTPGRWDHSDPTCVVRRGGGAFVYVQRVGKKEWTIWIGRDGCASGYVDVRYTKREAMKVATWLLRDWTVEA